MTASHEPALCSPRALPKHRLLPAAACAVEINPLNAPFPQAQAGSVHLEPLQIALLTSNYWGTTQRRLTVTFTEYVQRDLRRRITRHLNAWYLAGAGVRFAYTASFDADVRITRDMEGYWSYVGTDVLQISHSEPTMCLQNFTMRTPESEFIRVVRHEAGHTLGFMHEHMRAELVNRLDPAKTYAWALRTQGWDEQTTREQILTPLDERSIMATPADQTSIMCYQLPGSITRDGLPILGGTDFSPSDTQFAAKVYPRSTT